MTGLTYQSRPSLRRPFLACAFGAWSDAAEVSTPTVAYLEDLWGARDELAAEVEGHIRNRPQER